MTILKRKDIFASSSQEVNRGRQYFPVPMGSLFFLLAGVVAGESWGVLEGVGSRLLPLTVWFCGTLAIKVSSAMCSSSRRWSPAITLRTKSTCGRAQFPNEFLNFCFHAQGNKDYRDIKRTDSHRVVRPQACQRSGSLLCILVAYRTDARC